MMGLVLYDSSDDSEDSSDHEDKSKSEKIMKCTSTIKSPLITPSTSLNITPETLAEVTIPTTEAGFCMKCSNAFPSTDAAFCPRSNLSQHILIYSLSVQSYLILCSCVCILYVDVAIHVQ